MRRDQSIALRDADRLELNGRALEALDALTEVNRTNPSPDLERRLVRLRNHAFAELDATAATLPSPAPVGAGSSPMDDGLPAIEADDLDPSLLRGGVLKYGSVIVRNLVDPERAAHLVKGIDRVFQSRDAHAAGEMDSATAPWFEPFEPDAEAADVVDFGRTFVSSGSGVWLADSPRLLFQLTETFEAMGIRSLVTGYLGERPAISLNKGTLRRAEPSVPTEWWHQDGAFLGEGIRSLNIWLALTDCGRDAPGIDVVPRRLEGIVESGTDGADFDWSVGRPVVDRVSGGRTSRPVFRPGDALLFDHLCLHKTAVGEEMRRTRYATETWFFAPSAYPDPRAQIPLVF